MLNDAPANILATLVHAAVYDGWLIMRNPAKLLIAVGLCLGGVLGMVGTVVADPNLRAVSWAVDSVGLIIATALLALHYFRENKDLVAAGFLVYAIGEGAMLSGTAATLDASVPAFAAGTALWSAALLMTSVPKEFALWSRFTGVVAAVLFAIVSLRTFAGAHLTPLSSPLPFFAYPFLVLTFAGWFWKTIRSKRSE